MKVIFQLLHQLAFRPNAVEHLEPDAPGPINFRSKSRCVGNAATFLNTLWKISCLLRADPVDAVFSKWAGVLGQAEPCEAIFRAQETNTPHVGQGSARRARVAEEPQRSRGIRIAEHLKLVLSIIDQQES